MEITGTRDITATKQTFSVEYVSSMGTKNMHNEVVDIKIHFPIDGAKYIYL